MPSQCTLERTREALTEIPARLPGRTATTATHRSPTLPSCRLGLATVKSLTRRCYVDTLRPMIPALVCVFAGLFGLAFGSFLNVCLTRWPEEENVVTGRSHCRFCGRTLRWWENLPLVSWLALHGRCRTCNSPIPSRYPLVELAVGGLWAYAGWHTLASAFDPLLPMAVFVYQLAIVAGTVAFLWLLVALALLDARHFWLPDRLVWPGILLGMLSTLVCLAMASGLNRAYLGQISPSALPVTGSMASVMKLVRFIDGLEIPGFGGAVAGLAVLLAGPVLAAALILLIRWIYWLIRHREGVGLGDVKLMAMLAAWLGLDGALLAFSLACILGLITVLALSAIPAARTENGDWSIKKLPFGSFLCLGAIVSVFWGGPLIAAYEHWAGF